jgi:CarboxypepD_reg-like domain
MRHRLLARICVTAVVVMARPAHVDAQSASLIGTVVRDTLDHRLAGAEISIVALRRSTTANYQGEFRLDALPSGRYAVTVRHVGFAPLTDTVELKDNVRVEHEFVLVAAVAVLDSVLVKAQERKYISPGLNAFEERRRMGFGHFITDSVLRRYDNDQLSTVIRRIPGIHLVPYRGGQYAGASRALGSGAQVFVNPGDGKSPKGCWSTVYLDGAVIYTIMAGRQGAQAIDYNSFSVNTLAAVEYYAGGSTVPAQYGTTEYGCGTLLLWTRER